MHLSKARELREQRMKLVKDARHCLMDQLRQKTAANSTR